MNILEWAVQNKEIAGGLLGILAAFARYVYKFSERQQKAKIEREQAEQKRLDDALAGERAAFNTSINNMRKDFERLFNDKQRLIEDNQKTIGELKDELDGVERRLLQSNNDHQATLGRVATLEKQNIELVGKIEMLKRDLVDMGKNYEEEKRRADNLQAINNRLTADNQTLIRNNQSLSDQLNIFRSEMSDLKKQVEVLTTERASLAKRLAEVEARQQEKPAIPLDNPPQGNVA